MEKNKKIPIVIDDNSNLGYEKKSKFYFLMLPIIWLLTIWVAIKKKILSPNLKTNTLWFDGLSSFAREVKNNATRWKALDIVYNHPIYKDKNFIDIITTEFWWHNLLSTRATRNRLRLLKHLLKNEIQNYLNHYPEVRIISVASGSAQGVIEVIKDFREKPVRVLLLDLDTSALEYSKKLAKEAQVEDKIIFVNKSAKELENIGKEFSPHIVEVVGFLMYRPKEKAIKLVERIHRILVPNGALLISQDNYIPERFFLYFVVNWPIIFRSPEEFSEILIKGGFNPSYFKIIYEPIKMHGIAICKKIV